MPPRPSGRKKAPRMTMTPPEKRGSERRPPVTSEGPKAPRMMDPHMGMPKDSGRHPIKQPKKGDRK